MCFGLLMHGVAMQCVVSRQGEVGGGLVCVLPADLSVVFCQ